MPIGARLLLWSRLGRTIGRVGLIPAVVALAACAEPETQTTDPNGQLFARGLDEITDLYIEPITSQKLVLAGAARLNKLDDKLEATLAADAGRQPSIELSYDGRDIAWFKVPADTSALGGGDLLATIIATAKQASPRLAATREDAIDKAVFDGITGALDRFSRYSPPELARDQRAARDGFGGIGVTLDTGDEFRIAGVTPDGPAARAGLQAGDKITAIDGAPTAGRASNDIIHQLRGPVDSAITITIARAGVAGTRDVRLQRALVIVPTVTVSHDGNIAIVHVASFNQSTTQRVTESLLEARREAGGQLGGIVLDLRGNPGGLLDQAVSLADLFIAKGPIIATIGRHPASRQFFAASGNGMAEKTPVAVLINGGSASASEIVAAALQDVGRAVVIGSSSYGKGTVQTVMRLPNDGELTLTWARLITPSGYLLQEHGVVPTLCTDDLTEDDRSLDTALQRVRDIAPGSASISRPRATLDEQAWTTLRKSCPGQSASPTIDIKIAERVLSDPVRYSEALGTIQPAAASARVSELPPTTGPALTPGDRALSSKTRTP